jgi:hypothetical protein
MPFNNINKHRSYNTKRHRYNIYNILNILRSLGTPKDYNKIYISRLVNYKGLGNTSNIIIAYIITTNN